MSLVMSRGMTRGMSQGVNEIGELVITIGRGADGVTETITVRVQALAQALAHGALPQVCVWQYAISSLNSLGFYVCDAW